MEEEHKDLSVLYQQEIKPRLELIDHIRSLTQTSRGFKDVQEKLPTIVVTGDQSAGKSSVLESISGIPFPTGDNIVTRMPCEVQMREGDAFKAECSYQDGGDPVEFSTPEEVTEWIRATQNEVAGDTVGVVDEVIKLRVQWPGAADLTLVDLPGIVRVALEGQAEDIEAQVKNMIDRYIKREAAVILAVIPATSDFATMECIKMAQKVDPEGKRTLGVVTMIDKAEKGIQDKLEASRPSDLKLKLGFVAVKNLTKDDRELHGVCRIRAREIERQFFTSGMGRGSHLEELQDMDKSLWGIDTLENKLLQIQAERIQEFMPQLLDSLRTREIEIQAELAALPRPVESENEAAHEVSKVAKDFAAVFGQELNAPKKAGQLTIHSEIDALVLRALLEIKAKIPDFMSEDFADIINEAGRRFRGSTLHNFPSWELFRSLFLDHVHAHLEKPVQDTISSVFEGTAETVDGCIKKLSSKIHEKLRGHLQLVMDNILENAYTSTAEYISRMIENEKQPYTANRYYMDTVTEVEKGIADARYASEEGDEKDLSVLADVIGYACQPIDFAMDSPTIRAVLEESDGIKGHGTFSIGALQFQIWSRCVKNKKGRLSFYLMPFLQAGGPKHAKVKVSMFKDAEKTERFCQHVIDIDTIQGNNAPGPDDFRGDCYWLDELKETGWIRFLESQYECFVSVRLVNVSNTKQKLRDGTALQAYLNKLVSNEDQGLLKIQISLSAYTKCMFKSLQDNVLKELRHRMITVLQASMVEEITEHFKRLPLLELMTDQWVEHRRKQLQQNKEGVQDTLRHAERVVGLGGLPGAQTSSTATGHEKGSRRRFFCRVHI